MATTTVIRAPSLKRGKVEQLTDRIKLKKVLGLTVCSDAALDVSPTTGVLAYPAGCTVVLSNPRKSSQSFLLNTSRKAITAVAYSQCGRYIATGECGISPSIKVWELDTTGDSHQAGTVVAEFAGHKYAISCVAFSTNGKYLVSVGSQHDMIVNVFDWKSNLKIASNKVSAKVVAVSFSEDGNYFVTAGNRHVKFWYLEGSRKYKDTIPLMGRSAILGDHRNSDFCAVACGKGRSGENTYAITRSGHLVEFNSRRILTRFVDCKITPANCVAVSSQYIFVGCAESIVRCFNPESLNYVTTLPRTHYLGVDVSKGVQINHMMDVPPNGKFPDTIACVFDEERSKLSCIYNDHSLYVWDVKDISRVGKTHSFLYHSACIWGVETVPFNYTTKSNVSENLPLNAFLTCSSDDTIRVWELDGCDNNQVYRKNIYSKDLLKVAYIDDELNFIKDIDNPIWNNNEKGASYDSRNGVRCIKISPDRTHLATGDRSGNIRIYDLSLLKLITTIEAHDSEVLCLEYTNDKIDKKLLASASRDRLIHVFDVEQGYKILQTLDDHSSSITSIKFIGSGLNFQMISCGADKAIIFRAFQNNQFLKGNNCNGKNTLFDMEVDSNSKHILTACQDRNIRVYGTQNAKQTKTFKGSHSDEGSLIKLTLDMSGIYVATSCTDKTLSVYDYYSNECMARMYGHSELVTGLKFTNDCQYLISASGDGCIFIWQVPHDMIVTMKARLSQQALRSGFQPITRPITIAVDNPSQGMSIEAYGSPPIVNEDTTISPGYKFSDVGQLPQWAKRKTSTDETPAIQQLASSPTSNTSQNPVNPKPRGRWALRGEMDLDLRNILDPSSPNTAPTSDYNSSSSKDLYNNNPYLSEDSSIDSGVENRRKVKIQLHSESNTEHDGDIEDISDGERTSSDHGMVFYPSGVPGTPTEFKVNEITAEEIRKSMRRTKLEKQGLQVNFSQGATSTGTGTGTSDDEDDVSTPSGDNADRSLASTLGEEENIPNQATNSFLNTIDGALSDRERGRKSLSTMHNSFDNPTKQTPVSKSFTNGKIEELRKAISSAKQQLENGPHTRKNFMKSKIPIEVGYRSNLRGSQSITDLSHSANLDNQRLGRIQRVGETGENNFLNCAAPKAVLTQHCNIVRQFRQNMPPYPDSGIYARSPNESGQKTPDNSDAGTNSLKPGISHNSCPVSPVNEELDWHSSSHSSAYSKTTRPKRTKAHSIYSDDAKLILDMIHMDTEKMIQEITDKYGDLDDPKVDAKSYLKPATKVVNKRVEELKCTAQKDKNEHGFLSEEEGNFSSDSLEDCSLTIDPKPSRKKVCTKQHHKKSTEYLCKTPPRSASDYFVYEEFYNRDRKVSLSEILGDDDDIIKEQKFLETQRHSSASFFLSPSNYRKSQESLLSDDISGGVSFCNSMESILSDESECRSAPLEVLFNKCKTTSSRPASANPTENISKSYGSSPNATTGFDYYMQNVYSIDDDYPLPSIPTSKTYPKMAFEQDDFEIPTSKTKIDRFNSNVNKSLSKEFANQRIQNNSNPLVQTKEDLFVKKPLTRADIFQEVIPSNMRKSCSFEIDMTDGNQRRTEKSFKKFEQNLQKFERERFLFGNSLQMDYVPHKPPVASRRSASMRAKNKKRLPEKFNTIGDVSQTKPEPLKVAKKATSPIGNYSVNFSEKYSSDENFDSLEGDLKRETKTEMSVDSLDNLDSPVKNRIFEKKANPIDMNNFVTSNEYAKFRDIEKKISVINKLVEMEERKLEQERMLKESRMTPFQANSKEKGYVKSLTMNFDKLAQSAINDRENVRQIEQERKMKRNRSLPDVLEGAKFRSFQVLEERTDDVVIMKRYYNDFSNKNKNNTNLQLQRHDSSGLAKSLLSVSNDESSIRRACSLSDLSIGKGFKTPSSSAAGASKLAQTSNRSSVPNRIQVRRNSNLSGKGVGQGTSNGSSSGLGNRSVSVGMLNQVVSGNDLSNEESDSDRDSRLMKPTISSQNKVNGSSRSNLNGSNTNLAAKPNSNLANRRRGMQNAYSSGNLNSADQDDSSSEDTSAPTVISNSGKPVVPPRPRAITAEQKRNNNLNNIINAKNRPQASNMGSSNSNNNLDNFTMDNDISSEELNFELCSGIINQLRGATNSVLQLHQRLKENDDSRLSTGGKNNASSTSNNNIHLLRRELENAVIMTLNMLTKITNNNNMQHGGGSNGTNLNFGLSSSDMNGGGGPENYRQMFETCADILNTVQKQVNNHSS